MINKIVDLAKEYENEIIQLTQELVRIKSYTSHEKQIAEFIKLKMIELNYDKVFIDKLGNVIGVIGNGNEKIMFDSHMDTVSVKDLEDWTVDPFGGELKKGNIYGRGSVDMKAGIASTIYAGYIIKKLGFDKGKTIYISASVMEEDYDGEAMNYLIEKTKIKPDYVVVCEPSNLTIGNGHRGRAMIEISLNGISVHGSVPERGVNPIYGIYEIIKRIEDLNNEYFISKDHGSITVTKIESKSASLNATPNLCTIYIDRRLEVSEDIDFITNEMNKLILNTNAKWEIYDAVGLSWTGEKIISKAFYPAWEIDSNSKLLKSAVNAYKKLYNKEPVINKMNFSTNAVSSAGTYNIPTIVYGAGDVKMAHMVDEFCPVKEIIEAFMFYILLVLEI